MHSVYNSIDKAGDISHKGMFTKSWNERLPKFCINHDYKMQPGKTLRVFDDENGAYTEVKFGNWTLGNDALEMADAGIFTGASFEYIAQKKDYGEVKGRKIRNLREVYHGETSILTVDACHPDAKIVSLTKAFEDLEDNDIETLLQWHNEQLAQLKSYVEKIDAYCRNAKASDQTIITLANSLQEYKNIISQYDTAFTHVANEPDASDEEIKAMLMRMQIALTI